MPRRGYFLAAASSWNGSFTHCVAHGMPGALYCVQFGSHVFLEAPGAYAVTETHVAAIADVPRHALPVVLVVANFLAAETQAMAVGLLPIAQAARLQ
jgi:hypothetical protein